MEEGIVFFLATLMQVALVFTGRALVKGVSLGRWRGEHLKGTEGRVYAMAGALSFKRNGQRVVTGLGLLLAGGAFYALVAWAAIALTA